MKTLSSLLCLVAAASLSADEIHHFGTNVSTDPAIRIQAVKQGDQPYQCSIYPEIATAFDNQGADRIEIVVSFRTTDSGFMTTSRTYSKSSEKPEMIMIEFTEASMGNIYVEVRYSDSRRMWFGKKQNLGELCKDRKLPLLF